MTNRYVPPSPEDQLARVKAFVEIESDLRALNRYADSIHAINQPFYHDITTGELLFRNKAELIALIHSELSEMLEGVRKDEPDKHLPHRRSEEVEAADVLLRLLDYCGYRGLDLAGAAREKLLYNATRHDHRYESRRTANGKKF